ncbi:MAG: formylglycine-generating enzyme family protein [Limisphaerales bacterium]|mgnify:CR=1 FL=1|jgi:formylglycine-generating enzyme required for sulfatase activity|nr:formylglycine-generating enzyme family protein [Verrucomicrobiota bacterium]
MNKSQHFKKSFLASLLFLFFLSLCSSQTLGQDIPPESENWIVSLPAGVTLELLYIAPGTFMMGSPEDERGREDSEKQYEVTLTKGYYLGKYTVTQEQWEALSGSNPSKWKAATLPVERVSWADAMEFCQKLTEVERSAGRISTNWEYSLPTEAQWEYACRGGTMTALNNGKNLDCSDKDCRGESANLAEVAWYDKNGERKTHPVGLKKPNNFGLYDMHGNVWEWCFDWYAEYPDGPAIDPQGPDKGTAHVRRGGSWGYYAKGCRSAARASYSPNYRLESLGFRLALVPCR